MMETKTICFYETKDEIVILERVVTYKVTHKIKIENNNKKSKFKSFKSENLAQDHYKQILNAIDTQLRGINVLGQSKVVEELKSQLSPKKGYLDQNGNLIESHFEIDEEERKAA